MWTVPLLCLAAQPSWQRALSCLVTCGGWQRLLAALSLAGSARIHHGADAAAGTTKVGAFSHGRALYACCAWSSPSAVETQKAPAAYLPRLGDVLMLSELGLPTVAPPQLCCKPVANFVSRASLLHIALVCETRRPFQRLSPVVWVFVIMMPVRAPRQLFT